MPGFTLAVVGRPNVGKSTLFNRLLEQRKAIVEDTPGVTRDRQYGISEWNGKSFNVIDTGGFVAGGDDVFEKEIRAQVLIAVEEADAILLMPVQALLHLMNLWPIYSVLQRNLCF
jgi:GTP-binding protein